jgi:non-specific serine/threonine protein kinase
MDKTKELIAIIKPNGNFEIDFDEKRGKSNIQDFGYYEDLLKSFREDKYETLFLLGLEGNDQSLSISFRYLLDSCFLFIKELSRDPAIEFLRENITMEINEAKVDEQIEKAPYMIGGEYLSRKWFESFFKALNKSFARAIATYNGSVKDYFEKHNSKIHLVGRIFFHLVESKDETMPFAFLATYSSFVSSSGQTKHLPLKNALVEYNNDQEKMLKLLSTVNKASEESEFIAQLIESGEIFHPIKLTAEDAYLFLKEIEIYEDAGIICRIPKWWGKKKPTSKIALVIGGENKSKVNFDALVDFDANLYFANEKVTAEEIEQLLLEAEGLSFIKGKWVEVDHEKLKKTLEAYKKAKNYSKNNPMTVIEAMRFELDYKKQIKIKDQELDLEVTNGEFFNSIISRLSNPETIEIIDVKPTFEATLRNYQEKGLNWLYFMKSLGLGACLADDMGLGKTIQVLALLNQIKEQKEKTLILLPVSLIGNWMHEIEKFTPKLKYHVLHPSENNDLRDDQTLFTSDYDLYLTSYGMINKFQWLSNVQWDNLIIDEAQAIKNPGTKRTQSTKKIDAKFKIAMTGTPIENRLGDLWSLFDFLNPGLLGNRKEFKSYIKNLIEHHGDYSQLKHVVNPFILRRLKTDQSIISDLPEKVEMKAYASLTKKQSVLYEKLVRDLTQVMASEEEGIKRKGMILSSIMKFKQICNHPDQYLGQKNYLEKESGKFKRLREIAEEIYEKRERVIIFTQFRETIEPIKNFLEKIFKHKGYALHGGTKVKERKKIVDTFQGEAYVPFIVLSIKAGGVGLNLTRANHVIHFDRWWNPAVEDQATDRAFRIGQKKNVVVHKFITKGTIEEKIDEMIEDKRKLSDDIISTDQTGVITEMSNEEILDLIRLNV